MCARTVDWTTAPTPGGTAKAEGLRERKKRLMRRQLSDTATEMFVERGFDAVRVSEVAQACGVSEKTVFNYFPTKESLVMDRFDATMASLRAGLAEPGAGPVRAALRILDGELDAMVGWLQSQQDPAETIAKVKRFATLIHVTPALRAYQRDVRDELIDVAAGVMADRAGVGADEPEPRIAATALLGLWEIHFRSLRKHLDQAATPARIREAVTTDVRRAARLVEAGLWSFGLPAQGAPGTEDNRPVSLIERPIPPMNIDERGTLEGWLDFHRATLEMKCEGLDDRQAAAASVPPSGFTLTGLVQHLAEVERNWFRRVFAGEHAPPIHDPQADPDGPDGGFELAPGATLHDALASWHAEVARSREICAAHSLTDTGSFMGTEINLRWIYVHLIEEYARHNGHADLLRERIDGATGV